MSSKTTPELDAKDTRTIPEHLADIERLVLNFSQTMPAPSPPPPEPLVQTFTWSGTQHTEVICHGCKLVFIQRGTLYEVRAVFPDGRSLMLAATNVDPNAIPPPPVVIPGEAQVPAQS